MSGGGQLQIGLWLTTRHLALNPHTPTHGSIHFRFTQALSLGQSALMVHSGLQSPLVVLPKNPGKHSQINFVGLQMEFNPHGDGLQKSRGGGTVKLSILVI